MSTHNFENKDPKVAEEVWTDENAKAFYEELCDKAIETIPDIGAVMVLGPMFILRSPEENFELFRKANLALTKMGMNVFDQLPWVDYNLGKGNAPFRYDIKFESFYKKLIQSGKIKACYLLPDWDKSEGTKTEVKYCKESGVPVYEYTPQSETDNK